MLNVAAATIEGHFGNKKLIDDLRTAAKEDAKGKAEGRGWTQEDVERIERQRTLFTMLPVSGAVDRLKEAMLQHAYDLMWDGQTEACDAIVEFLPSIDVDRMFEAWERDTMSKGDKEPRSRWYEGKKP